MNYLDLGIILLLGFGAVLGFKRGFTNQLVRTVGFILTIVLAFQFKGVVSEFLYMNFPFFKFGGLFKGVSVLNILVYEVIAFFIVLSVLGIGLRLLLLATSLFESILNATIILGIPSKIMGAIVGVIQSFIIIFVILFFLSLPFFTQNPIEESEYASKILKNIPVLSEASKKTVSVADEVYLLRNKYTESENNEFNLASLNILLKYKLVSVENIDNLVDKDKLQIDNIESVVKNYR